MPRPRSALLAVALLGAVLAACDDDSGPGTVTVSLQSPAGDEGAFLVLVRDEALGPIESAVGTAFRRPVDGGVRVAVIRQEPGPLSFRMEVDDRGGPPTVELLQVAGPDDALRPNLGAYSLEVR